MTGDLHDRTILITAANTGIGRAAAHELARQLWKQSVTWTAG